MGRHCGGHVAGSLSAQRVCFREVQLETPDHSLTPASATKNDFWTHAHGHTIPREMIVLMRSKLWDRPAQID
jgi:hypothetical protein